MSLNRGMDDEEVVCMCILIYVCVVCMCILIYVCVCTYAYICDDILLSIMTKEWRKAIYSNMAATRDYHTKWSMSEKERQVPYGITKCGI